MPDEDTVNQEAPPRRNVVAASVSDPEQEEVLAAFSQAGFRVKSQAARVILLSYSRSTRVRDAVSAFVRDNMDLMSA